MKHSGAHYIKGEGESWICWFKKRRLRGYLIAVCSYLMGESRKDRDRLFSEMHSDRIKKATDKS